MSARDALFWDIWDNRTTEEKNALIDAALAEHAHELAERLRAEGVSWGEQSAAGKVYHAAADLIAPETKDTPR